MRTAETLNARCTPRGLFAQRTRGPSAKEKWSPMRGDFGCPHRMNLSQAMMQCLDLRGRTDVSLDLKLPLTAIAAALLFGLPMTSANAVDDHDCPEDAI